MDHKPLLLDEFIPYRLSFTTNLVSDMIAQIYHTLFDLSIPEWRVIAWVAQSNGIAQHDIGERTRMDKLAVSRAAVALAGRGLLERRQHPTDRRSHLLFLSHKGRELYDVVAPKALELEERLFSSFTAEELVQFVNTLRRIDAIALEMAEARTIAP